MQFERIRAVDAVKGAAMRKFGDESKRVLQACYHGQRRAARLGRRPLHFKIEGAFGHQQDALIVVLSHAAPRGEPRPAVQVQAHAVSLVGRKAPGGGQPGFTYAK